MPIRPTLEEIIGDLIAEHADLDAVVAALPGSDWDSATPAAGWSVRDTISHLAFFDETATQSMTAPDAFRVGLEQVWADPEGFIQTAVARGRAMTTGEVLLWWRNARGDLVAAFRALDPEARMPWFGPDMGAVSFCTARLMEPTSRVTRVTRSPVLAPSTRLRGSRRIVSTTYSRIEARRFWPNRVVSSASACVICE